MKKHKGGKGKGKLKVVKQVKSDPKAFMEVSLLLVDSIRKELGLGPCPKPR